MEKTLADKISKISKAVPKIKPKSKASSKTNKKNIILKQEKNPAERIPISAIAALILKNAVEKVKEEKPKIQNRKKEYKILKEEIPSQNAYASRAAAYGNTSSSYIDYGKLFSYLGKFRANGSFYASSQESGYAEGSKVSQIDFDTIQRTTNYIRNFAPGLNLNLAAISPDAGMSSKEWDEFRMWARLNPVLYRLNTSTL